jgi:hypothetical protein
MSNENSLIVESMFDLDTTQGPDQAIVKINQAFIQLYNERRQKVIHLLRQVPSVIGVIQKLADKSYRVVIPPDVLKRLEDGTVHWDRHADGLLGAIIRDNETGQIICQISLKEISPELLSSISQLAVQRTLAEILQRLEVIDQKITDVLQGQRNDRLAIVDSGVHLYQQAIVATDLENRRQLLLSAIEQLNEGRQRLIVTLETDIQFIDRLPRKSWQIIFSSLFQDMPKYVESKAKPVQEAFQAILRASYVLASAYEALGELESLRVSLKPLKEVILKVGTKGEQIARWLPYDASSPPEKLWHSGLLQLTDGIAHTSRQMESVNLRTIEVAFMPGEIIDGEAE